MDPGPARIGPCFQMSVPACRAAWNGEKRSRRVLPMLAKVQSSAVIGVDAYLVEVEVDIAQGLPVFATVGLPERRP